MNMSSDDRRPPPEPIPEEKIAALRELLFSGRKIEAIRLYRQLTRGGLKDSKERVEELESLLRKQSPEKFSAAPQGKGCLGVVLLVCVAVALLGYWIVRRGL